MAYQYANTPKCIFYLSQSSAYGNCNLNTTADQQLRRTGVGLNFGVGGGGEYIVTGVFARLNGAATGSPVGGIYTGAGKTGSQIVASTQAWDASTLFACALNSAVCADPFAGGNYVRLSATPYLSLTVASSNSCGATIWVFGYEMNEVY